MQKLLATNDWVSVTTDIWTSNVLEGNLCLTAHFITKDFERKSVLLQCTQFNESHTAPRILALFESCLLEWGLDDRFHLVIRDGVQNMVAAFRDSFNNMTCLIHTIQLVVSGGCLDMREVRETLACAQKLVGHFKHSVAHSQALKNKQQQQLQLPCHHLVQDVPTRWNSAHDMLIRLIEGKVSCDPSLQRRGS